MNSEQIAQLRQLPSVDRFLKQVAPLIDLYGREMVTAAVRDVLAQLRSAIRGGSADIDLSTPALSQQVSRQLADQIAPTLFPVINATGVIIHTNLGRAPLSENAIAAIEQVARGYSNLEFDMTSGKRGSRSVHAVDLVQKLTGAPAATVVNNSASGVLLMLSALCAGKEVIVSRGQLVEIGGGFRMPDVMRQAGVTLVEVGTTNRTHLRDYANAITANTAAILSIHHSNYKIIGFTTEPSLHALATLSHQYELPLLFDQGSGALLDTTSFGLEQEPLVQTSVADGCDVIVFSGDKLLGGPQAGVICGRSDLIATIKRHPLARAVRPDKLAYAGLAATFDSYVRGKALEEIPVWQMLSQSVAEIEDVATRWCAKLREAGIRAAVIDGQSTIGGGSLPGQSLPTKVVAIEVEKPDLLAEKLRFGKVGIIGRIHQNTLLIDPRTVLPHQRKIIPQLLVQAAVKVA